MFNPQITIMPLSVIKEKINNARKGAKILSSTLSKVIKINDATIWRWYNGKTNPSIEQYDKLIIMSDFYESYIEIKKIHEKEMELKKQAIFNALDKLDKR